ASAGRATRRRALEPARTRWPTAGRHAPASGGGAGAPGRAQRWPAGPADAAHRGPAPASRPGLLPRRPHRAGRPRPGLGRPARSQRRSRPGGRPVASAGLPGCLRHDHRLPCLPGGGAGGRRLPAPPGSRRGGRGLRSAAGLPARPCQPAHRAAALPGPAAAGVRVPPRRPPDLGRDRGHAAEPAPAPGGGRMSALISVEALRDRLGSPGLVIVDGRHVLTDPDAGERAWRQSRIPGAVHVHLDRDLCDLSRPAAEGRHPLPRTGDFLATLARLGISPASEVVAYDDAGGAMVAARFWWLLRLLGHARVSVLDGGFSRWRAEGGPLEQGTPATPAPARYLARFERSRIVASDDVQARLGEAPGWLIDARAPERYRGEQEPLDPVAGHIPGALNRP